MKLIGFFAVFSSAQVDKISELADPNLQELFEPLIWFNSLAYEYGFYKYIEQKFVENLQYGCWGQIKKTEARPGGGEPVDSFDQLFHDWRQCSECTNLDFEEPCEDTWYNWPNYDFLPQENANNPDVFNLVKYDCSTNTGCHKARCECNVALVYGIIEGLYSGEFDPNHEVKVS